MHFSYTVPPVQSRGKRFVQLLINQIIRPRLRVTVLLALVLIFVTFTTSCSLVQVNQKSECFNQSAEGCVHHQVRIPF